MLILLETHRHLPIYLNPDHIVAVVLRSSINRDQTAENYYTVYCSDASRHSISERAALFLFEFMDLNTSFISTAEAKLNPVPAPAATTHIAQLLRDSVHNITAEQIAKTLNLSLDDTYSALTSLIDEGVIYGTRGGTFADDDMIRFFHASQRAKYQPVVVQDRVAQDICQECNGTGQTTYTLTDPEHLTPIESTSPCYFCDGTGHTIDSGTITCPACHGSGKLGEGEFIFTCYNCEGKGFKVTATAAESVLPDPSDATEVSE